MKFFVELFRQQKSTKQGILWWNIRDGWPILSDAVVDYYFEKKLAFHYLQRVQRDVQAICCEEEQGKHAVVMVNDTLKPARGQLVILRAGDSAKLLEAAFDVEPNGKATLGSLTHPARQRDVAVAVDDGRRRRPYKPLSGLHSHGKLRAIQGVDENSGCPSSIILLALRNNVKMSAPERGDIWRRMECLVSKFRFGPRSSRT